MEWIKKIIYVLLLVFLLGVCYIAFFIYRAKVGLPFYESEPHNITIPEDRPAILLFSKTNGFVHSEAIKAAIPAFKQMAEKNNWFIYETKDAGIFNQEQLSTFETTIWNNVSGNVLTTEQRNVFKDYILTGGGFIGIHAAGDGSHAWDWYVDRLIDAKFSHHPIENHIQPAMVLMEMTQDTSLWRSLANQWEHKDEWYIFHDNPRENGSTILHTINGENIDPSGVLGPLEKDKTYGMGKDHPVVWYNYVGQGRSLYSSMGHTGQAFEESNYLSILENAIKWTAKLN